MTHTTTAPIHTDWPTTVADTDGSGPLTATAADISARLARLEVADIDPTWVPYLSAAAAELASIAGIPWRFSTDDPAVALLRLIARATIANPDASGPHTRRLLERLP
jgi:hypothetical protein